MPRRIRHGRIVVVDLLVVVVALLDAEEERGLLVQRSVERPLYWKLS